MLRNGFYEAEYDSFRADMIRQWRYLHTKLAYLLYIPTADTPVLQEGIQICIVYGFVVLCFVVVTIYWYGFVWSIPPYFPGASFANMV